MQESSYLNPDSIKQECNSAIAVLNNDNASIEIIKNSLTDFTSDEEIKSDAFTTLKQQISDYSVVMETMTSANDLDIHDYERLISLVGDEELIGSYILQKKQEAKDARDEARRKASEYRSKAHGADSHHERDYYYGQASHYSKLADRWNEIYEFFKGKEEKFDEIDEATSRLFETSAPLRIVVKNALDNIEGAYKDGGYEPDLTAGWRELIEQIRPFSYKLKDEKTTPVEYDNLLNDLKKKIGEGINEKLGDKLDETVNEEIKKILNIDEEEDHDKNYKEVKPKIYEEKLTLFEINQKINHTTSMEERQFYTDTGKINVIYGGHEVNHGFTGGLYMMGKEDANGHDILNPSIGIKYGFDDTKTISNYKWTATGDSRLKSVETTFGESTINASIGAQFVDEDGKINPHLNAEAKTEFTALKTAIEVGTSKVDVVAGNAEAHANVSSDLFTTNNDGEKIFNPRVVAEVGASVTALEAKWDKQWAGNEMLGINSKTDVTVGKASAEASAGVQLFDENGEIDPQLGVNASLEAIAAEASGSVGLNVLGGEVAAKGSVNFGIGAHADVGYKDGVLKCDIGASLGVGVSAGIEVDVGGMVDTTCDLASSAMEFAKDGWEDFCGMFN